MEPEQKNRAGNGIAAIPIFLDQPRTWAIAAALAALGALFMLLLWNPSAPRNLFPPCIVHEISGLECPGCGITRSLHALIHGEIGQAFHYNAVGLPIILLAGLLLIKPWWISLKRNQWNPPRLFKGAAWWLLGVGVLWMIIRNLAGV